jgi:hypothetical protein
LTSGSGGRDVKNFSSSVRLANSPATQRETLGVQRTTSARMRHEDVVRNVVAGG